jgi:hypothetical protein
MNSFWSYFSQLVGLLFQAIEVLVQMLSLALLVRTTLRLSSSGIFGNRSESLLFLLL